MGNVSKPGIILTIYVHKTHVVFKTDSYYVTTVLDTICDKLTTYKYTYNPKTRRNIREKDKGYFAVNRELGEYRFPFNIFRDILLTLGSNGLKRDSIDLQYVDPVQGYPIDFKWNDKYVARDYQNDYVNTVIDNDMNTALVDLATGMGKMLDSETLIRCPGQWIKIKELEAGDQVLTQDGTYTEVTGVYPQGIQDMYTFTFYDKRTIRAGKEHLWKVFSPNWVNRKKNLDGWRVVDTGYLYNIYKDKSHNLKYFIHLARPEKGISKEDNSDVSLLNSFLNSMKLPFPMSIPPIYPDNSDKERYELLRGIVSGNKYTKIHRNGTISYNTDISSIKDDVVDLVRSLGGIATTTIIHPKKKFLKPIYRITIRLKYAKNGLPYTNQYDKGHNLRIESIILDEKADATCISVAHPSKLYVAQDYIVTHNTFIAMRILWHFKQRTAVLVLPKYVEKWISDIKEYSDVTDDDIYVVQGGSSLEKLCHMDINEMKYKFIVFSMVTVTNYINDYENNTLSLDVPPPQLLMEKLKIGVLFNDESHQHFHALYKAVLYFNVGKILGMTATLVSNRNDVNKIYNMLFPPKYRISNLVKRDPYVNVEAVLYELDVWKKVRYKTNQGYSHVVYEDYIMSHNHFLNSYLELIEEFFIKRYYKERVPGDKCLIYCSTIRMCTIVCNYLKEKYKDLSIGTYVESDSYDNIMNNDVSVSTLGSASTGLDIKGLTTVINTISVTSMQSNLQSLGRLRKIEGKELWYVYLYCKNIPTQIKMHKDRRAAIERTVKNYVYTTYYKVLRVR